MTVVSGPSKAPTRAATPDDEIMIGRFLTVEISTAELLEMEAALVYRSARNLELSSADRYRLRAIERELDRRWALEFEFTPSSQ